MKPNKLLFDELIEKFDESKHPRDKGKFTFSDHEKVGMGAPGSLDPQVGNHPDIQASSFGYMNHQDRTHGMDRHITQLMDAHSPASGGKWSTTKRAHFLTSVHGRHVGDVLASPYKSPKEKAASVRPYFKNFDRVYRASDY